METRPSGWFFAEWISIIGTFMVCFVFLFYQNQNQTVRFDQAMQSQTDRSDRLYEMFIDLVKERK